MGLSSLQTQVRVCAPRLPLRRESSPDRVLGARDFRTASRKSRTQGLLNYFSGCIRSGRVEHCAIQHLTKQFPRQFRREKTKQHKKKEASTWQH